MSRIEVRNSLEQPMTQQERRTETTVRTAAMGGSAAVAIGGICVAGLAIAGLANAIPGTLGAIATIVFGVVLVLQGGALTARFLNVGEPGGRAITEATAGLGAGVAGGIAGIVLGILSLLGIEQVGLMAVAVIVFGVCLWLSNVALTRFNTVMTAEAPMNTQTPQLMYAVTSWTTGMNALVGLAAVILGIVALGSMATAWTTALILSLVGLLCLGCAVLVSGSATSTRVLSFWSHR